MEFQLCKVNLSKGHKRQVSNARVYVRNGVVHTTPITLTNSHLRENHRAPEECWEGVVGMAESPKWAQDDIREAARRVNGQRATDLDPHTPSNVLYT